jgi:hypothetical protein
MVMRVPRSAVPFTQETTIFGILLLAAKSALPQLSGQHIPGTADLRSIFFSANVECWLRFHSSELHVQEVLEGACFHYIVAAFTLTLDESILGYSLLCLDFTEKPLMPDMQK